MKELDEPLLEDDYPVYLGYWYVVNGKPQQSMVRGTVKTLKLRLEKEECLINPEIRRCDAVGRDLRLW